MPAERYRPTRDSCRLQSVGRAPCRSPQTVPTRRAALCDGSRARAESRRTRIGDIMGLKLLLLAASVSLVGLATASGASAAPVNATAIGDAAATTSMVDQ